MSASQSETISASQLLLQYLLALDSLLEDGSPDAMRTAASAGQRGGTAGVQSLVRAPVLMKMSVPVPTFFASRDS
jgi:hypothetical protein